MSPTHDLKRVLQSAAETDRPGVDPADDLVRAVAAARARTRRRFRIGLAGVASAAVITVGAVTVLDREPADPGVAAPRTTGGVELVSETFEATPYTFDLTPQGWAVQGQRPSTVTIAPTDGSVSDHPDDFVGKLVIMFEANPPGGRPVDLDGRRFWITGDSGYTTISTRTLAGEPAGAVRIQYPDDTGWTEDTMLAFTASVHVGDTAQHGLG